jgi:Carboxypeptidase regulatory-like domain
LISPMSSTLVSSSKKVTVAIAIIVCLFLCAGGSAFGQDVRASLGGKVTDRKGAILRNATVAVTAVETGVVETTATNGSGDWIATALLPGHYRFEVKAPGFKTEERTSIELQVGDKKYVDTQMQVGTVSESVTVEATTPLIDLSSAVSGSVVTQTEIEQVPTQSNAVTMDVAILPGTTVSGGVGGGVFLWSNSGLSGTTVNGVGSIGGAGTGAINYSIDGGTANFNSGSLAFEPPMDAVSELRVIPNGYDASLGRGSSANEIISLKSGAEKFHGDLYENYQGSFLNANSYQNDAANPVTPIAPIHVNEYGGSVGGPVWIPKFYDGRKKETYFFFTYAGIRNIQPSDTGFLSVPTALERAGNFSQSYTTVSGVKYPIQLFNPYSTNASGQRSPYSFAGCALGTMAPVLNTCESLPGPIDPISAAYLKLIPLPQTAGDGASSDSNNYARAGEQNDKFRGYTLRADQTWNNQNHSFMSMYYNSFSELSNTDFGTGQYLPLEGQGQFRQNRGITFDHVITLKKSLVLDLSYHILNYVSRLYDVSGGIDPTTLGFPSSFASQMQDPSLPEITGVTSNTAINLGTNSAGQTTPADLNQDINVRMTETYKNHNFRYGAEYLIQQESNRNLGTSGGVFAFGANYTSQYGVGAGSNGNGVGSSIADFELGLPGSSSNIPTTTSAFLSARYTALYFQDDWRVTPKLTLSLGMRWDYERPTTERFNRYFSRYNSAVPLPTVTAASAPGYAAIYSGNGTTNLGAGLLQQWGPAPGAFQVMGGPEYAGINGTPRGETNPRYRYFQPRIGFAYQILNNTVLRGGVGRFVEASFNPSSNQTGFSSTTPYCPSACSNYDTVGATWDNPFPQGLVAPTGNSFGVLTNVGSPTGGTPTYVDPNIGRIYVDSATLAVQRQISGYLFEVGGVFNETHGLGMQTGNNRDINIPSAGAWIAANTPIFAASGLPSATLPGNTNETNPFKGVQHINASEIAASTVTAYQLLRPNPTAGDIYLNTGNGKDFYYALNTKVERRFSNGFSILQSFDYSKRISEDNLYTNQAVAVKIEKRLDVNDNRFHYTLTPIYELPFGKGKRFLNSSGWAVDELVGGWEFSGIYNFLSGVPIVFPTNTAFYQGGDPSLGNKKTRGGPGVIGKWFDTSKFAVFPSSSTTNATLANTTIYPTWTGVTGMPGAGYVPTGSSGPQNGVYQDFAAWNTYNPTTFGDVRQPYTTNFTLGLRKSFALVEGVRFQMRMDFFNALNHPTFASANTTVGNTFFGSLGTSANLTQSNSPRQVQLSGRLYF